MTVALGVIYCVDGQSYDGEVAARRAQAAPAGGLAEIDALLRRGHTWRVED